MGGDEFVLLLSGHDDQTFASRIEELKKLGAHAGSSKEIWGQVSISIGAAVYPSDGTEADVLLAEADRRMYQAKQADKLARAIPMRAAGQQRELGLATIQ